MGLQLYDVAGNVVGNAGWASRLQIVREDSDP